MEEKRRAKVYIPNRSGHDFSPAEQFGELVFVTSGPQHRYAVNNIYRTFAEAMQDAKPYDYLLVTGLNILNLIPAAIMARRFGRLNLLLFRQGGYIEKNVDIDSLIGGGTNVSGNGGSDLCNPSKEDTNPGGRSLAGDTGATKEGGETS